MGLGFEFNNTQRVSGPGPTRSMPQSASARTEATPSLSTQKQLDVVRSLQTEYLALEDHFSDTNAHQGFLGRTADWTKNHLGVLPLINEQNGSNATRETVHILGAKLSALHDAVRDGTLSPEAFRQRLGDVAQTAGYSHAEDLLQGLGRSQQQKQVETFQASQEAGADIIADIGTGFVAAGAIALAAPTGGLSLGALALEAALGAGVGAKFKTTLKAADAWDGGRHYGWNDVFYDAATGGVIGAMAPVAHTFGAGVGKTMGTRGASALTRSVTQFGAEGAGDGLVTGGSGGFARTLHHGGTLGEAAKNGLVEGAFGAVLGGVMGGALGAASHGLGRTRGPAPGSPLAPAPGPTAPNLPGSPAVPGPTTPPSLPTLSPAPASGSGSVAVPHSRVARLADQEVLSVSQPVGVSQSPGGVLVYDPPAVTTAPKSQVLIPDPPAVLRVEDITSHRFQLPLDPTAHDLEQVVPWRHLVRETSQPSPQPGTPAFKYWVAQAKARQIFWQGIEEGRAGDWQRFKQLLQQAHREAHYKGNSNDAGVIRTGGRMVNGYFYEAGEVMKQHGLVFPHTQNVPLVLRGIPEQFLPFNKGIEHFYPPGKHALLSTALDPYFTEMHRVCDEFMQMVPGETPPGDVMRKVAEFYQYAANARPFGEVNNSLFMNISNAMLNRHGLEGVAHGIWDHTAHRVPQDRFIEAFAQHIAEQNRLNPLAPMAENISVSRPIHSVNPIDAQIQRLHSLGPAHLDLTPAEFAQLPPEVLSGLPLEFYEGLPPTYFTDDLVVEGHRILGSGDTIYLNKSHFAQVQREAYGASLSDADIEDLFKEAFPADDAFVAAQRQGIQTLVEKPLHPIVEELMAQGRIPVYSNAFGPGAKGVYWKALDGTRGYTPLHPNFSDTTIGLHSPDGVTDYPVVHLDRGFPPTT